jgi:hypothetical protein
MKEFRYTKSLGTIVGLLTIWGHADLDSWHLLDWDYQRH